MLICQEGPKRLSGREPREALPVTGCSSLPESSLSHMCGPAQRGKNPSFSPVPFSPPRKAIRPIWSLCSGSIHNK